MKHFSVRSSKYIHECLRQMKDKGVINFMHDITFGHGQISMLVADPEIFQFYHENKIPIVCIDDSGRTLSDGVYINRILDDQYQECAIATQLLRETGRNMGLNYGRHSVHYVSREQDCQHLYSLYFDLSYNDFLHFVINNGALLQDLIENYNQVATDIILEAKSVENRIVLPSFSEVFSPSSINRQANTKQICVIHKNTQLPIHLSSQRSQCLLYLMQGKSTKEIALAMGLSPRTVDYYLNIIRNQLGCRSSKELIHFYGNQLL